MPPRTPARPAKCCNESESAKSSTCTVFTKTTAANVILPYPVLIMNSAQNSANNSENGWATRPPWFQQYTATHQGNHPHKHHSQHADHLEGSACPLARARPDPPHCCIGQAKPYQVEKGKRQDHQERRRGPPHGKNVGPKAWGPRPADPHATPSGVPPHMSAAKPLRGMLYSRKKYIHTTPKTGSIAATPHSTSGLVAPNMRVANAETHDASEKTRNNRRRPYANRAPPHMSSMRPEHTRGTVSAARTSVLTAPEPFPTARRPSVRPPDNDVAAGATEDAAAMRNATTELQCRRMPGISSSASPNTCRIRASKANLLQHGGTEATADSPHPTPLRRL